jgi:RNA polymerase sigma-70 factor (ECF subfamily)
MDEQEWLAQEFEEHRPRLRAVAYRMLGSLSEADDAVQDAWLSVSRADPGEVENLGALLTTVVARVALNTLRARRTRGEQPLDVRVPEQWSFAPTAAPPASRVGSGARRPWPARP